MTAVGALLALAGVACVVFVVVDWVILCRLAHWQRLYINALKAEIEELQR